MFRMFCANFVSFGHRQLLCVFCIDVSFRQRQLLRLFCIAVDTAVRYGTSLLLQHFIFSCLAPLQAELGTPPPSLVFPSPCSFPIQERRQNHDAEARDTVDTRHMVRTSNEEQNLLICFPAGRIDVSPWYDSTKSRSTWDR